jgi:hypothetical protein
MDGEIVDHLLLHCPFSRSLGYDFGPFWCPVGDAEDDYRASSLLAGLFWSS